MKRRRPPRTNRPPPEEQLVERRLREIGNKARDLTGAILGDPPVGRSALDKKIAKERADAAESLESWHERIRKHALPPVA